MTNETTGKYEVPPLNGAARQESPLLQLARAITGGRGSSGRWLFTDDDLRRFAEDFTRVEFGLLQFTALKLAEAVEGMRVAGGRLEFQAYFDTAKAMAGILLSSLGSPPGGLQPIEGAYLDENGWVALCQKGREAAAPGFAARLFAWPSDVGTPAAPMGPKDAEIEAVRAQLAEATRELEFQRNGHAMAQDALIEQGQHLLTAQAHVARLVEALEAGPSVEHSLPWGVPCTCSRCEFVRLRKAALSTDLTATADAPVEPALSSAAQDVLAERRRQVETEGWVPEHDDAHDAGELATAAACYAGNAGGYAWQGGWPGEVWPWSRDWWKPTTPRRDLVKAGALILAEIERLDRARGSREAV